MSNTINNLFVDEIKKVVCIWNWDGNNEIVKAYTAKGYKVFLPSSGNASLKNTLKEIISSRLS